MEMASCASFSSSIGIGRAIARPNITLSFSSSFPNLLNSASIAVKGRRRRNKSLTCNALFGLGVPELVVIAGVAALVFGPKKLPEVGRSIGKTVKSFQQAAKEFESELKKEPDADAISTQEDLSQKPEQEKQDIEVSSTKETV
ncbi:sec-independent protein translocase protein TATA, chloroplastic [Abrus precatorius]|uniref:Sec-independent protein translocase protein TATA, chloroplastic n=1 Tax=Abrus precatorius TaxID=3816 RepID=A0A8B8L973_ABRPR|nr:sec-independent protein translocase protein TATA, chloroplastic [Abrus precatorius]